MRVIRSLLAVLALASVAPAQDAIQFTFAFDRGLNLRDNGSTVATSTDYMTGDSYNFEIYPGTGVLYMRPGIEQTATTSGVPVGLRAYDQGAIHIDEAGVYRGGSLISDMLGTAITDSAYVKAAVSFLDSVKIVQFDRQYWIACVRALALRDCFIWKFNERTNAWTKWKAWADTAATGNKSYFAPRTWGIWKPSGSNRDRLFYGTWTRYIGSGTGQDVFMVDPTQTFDDDSSGTDTYITAQVITPTYTVPGALTTWKDALISLDYNTGVTVYATISRQNSDGTVSSVEKTILTLAPASGDSTPAGAIATYVAPINEDGYSCAIRIYQDGDSVPATTKNLARCRVHPGVIRAVRRPK